MAELAKLVVKLVADVTEFTQSMEAAAKKTARIGRELQAVGDRMTVGVTLPLIAAGTAATKFASDLAETRNKTSVVFGRMADDMLKFGKEASRTMGMSENAALSYAATYGSILTNMGIAEDEAAKMSKALTQLTADYASFHNLDPGEAFEKIKAGLVGSSQPLISLGKDLRQASVEAYAVANGIAKAGEKMTPAQLAMARFGALVAQSGKEMGDFARTSDGLANSTRTLKATFEDTFASFGELLIPTVTEFMQVLIPILQWFRDLPQPVKTAIVQMLLFAAAIGPVLSIVGRGMQLFSLFSGGLAGNVGIAGSAAKAAAGLGAAAKAAGGLLTTVTAAAAPVVALIAAIGLLIVVIKRFGPAAWESVQMLVAIGEVIRQQFVAMLTNGAKKVGEFLERAYLNVLSFRMKMMDAGKQLMTGFIRGIISMAGALIEAVIKPISSAVVEVRKILKLGSPSRLMKYFAEMTIKGFVVGVENNRSAPAAAMQQIDFTPPAVSQVGGGARSVQIGEIRVYGDLSDSQMRRMKEEMRRIAEGVFGEALA